MRTMLIALASLALAATAYAAPVWTAPGWYQTYEAWVGWFVSQGPFADESSCRATLPPDGRDTEGIEIFYGCEYLAERPDWDDL
jgi:hypothetical protein